MDSYDCKCQKKNVLEGFSQDQKDKAKKTKYNDYFLDDGYGGNISFRDTPCSLDCCGDQFPPLFMLADGTYKNKKNSKSQLSCNNANQNSGCLCMNEKQLEFIQMRGNNIK